MSFWGVEKKNTGERLPLLLRSVLLSFQRHQSLSQVLKDEDWKCLWIRSNAKRLTNLCCLFVCLFVFASEINQV